MSDTAPVLLSLQDVGARFRSQSGDLEALEHVSFEVRCGEFICLIGPSGCGKSTLLRAIAGLIVPAQGSILLEGQSQRKPGRRVSLVFQEPTLLPWRSVLRNIALPLEAEGRPAQEIAVRVAGLVSLVGLEGFEDEYPANLSGGMSQRTALARALAQSPDLLLLDEPFGALDALTRELMAAELLRIWQRDQRTVMMVTHSVEEAVLLADRVVVLSARPGRVMGIVEITLPRPRSEALRDSAELRRLTAELRRLLQAGNAPIRSLS